MNEARFIYNGENSSLIAFFTKRKCFSEAVLERCEDVREKRAGKYQQVIKFCPRIPDKCERQKC